MNATAVQINLKEYFAVAGSIYTADDAGIIGPALERLAEQGKSTPRQIVDAAKDERSPIHNYFEWRDGVAAELYREDQARCMARSIVVKVVDAEGAEQQIRAFYSAKIAVVESEAKRKPRQYPYVTLDRVQNTPAIAEQVINDALSQLISWKVKYAIYRELFTGFQRFDNIIKEIGALEEQDNI